MKTSKIPQISLQILAKKIDPLAQATLFRFMPNPQIGRVNLSSISEQLGVSISTVSRALRGLEGIHPETRARVTAMAHQMGYATRSAASSARIADNGPRQILALSQSCSPVIDQRFMAGMTGAAVASNVAILSHLVNADQCASVLNPRLAPTSLRTGLIEGLLLLHRWPHEVAAKLSRKFPAVSIVYDYPGLPIDVVGVDERAGIDGLIKHLYAAGHRKIGFFGLNPQVSWSSARYAAYIESLTRLDLAFDPAHAVRIDLPSALSPNPFPEGEWSDHVRRNLRANVDAWVCASSTTGYTLQRFLTAEGLNLPDDVAMVSFHGGSQPPPPGWPPITTADVVDEELGATALRRLIHRLDFAEESRRSILISSHLIVGQTTRPVPGPKGNQT